MDALSPARAPSSGSSFHYSFGLLPADRRRALEAVYAFSRAIDDVADEGPRDPVRGERALRRYRDELARCYDGAPTLPVSRDLRDAIVRFGIPRRPLEDLLDGVEMDLRVARYATFEELRPYCERVASAVGLTCLPIFGCRDPGSRDYALALGIALQLTNILRDLKSDADRGRIYIPVEEMRRFGYAEDDLLRGEHNDAYLAVMRLQAARAHSYFDAARALLPESDRPRLLAAEVMGAIYRRLLRRIEAAQFRVFDRRIAVPRLAQLGVALRARVLGQV
jgi:phytoene synthase